MVRRLLVLATVLCASVGVGIGVVIWLDAESRDATPNPSADFQSPAFVIDDLDLDPHGLNRLRELARVQDHVCATREAEAADASEVAPLEVALEPTETNGLMFMLPSAFAISDQDWIERHGDGLFAAAELHAFDNETGLSLDVYVWPNWQSFATASNRYWDRVDRESPDSLTTRELIDQFMAPDLVFADPSACLALRRSDELTTDQGDAKVVFSDPGASGTLRHDALVILRDGRTISLTLEGAAAELTFPTQRELMLAIVRSVEPK